MIDYKSIFNHNVTAFLIIKADSPKFTIIDANKTYLQLAMKDLSDIIDKGVFEAFPTNNKESEQILRDSFDKIITTKQRNDIAILKYDIITSAGYYEKRYWKSFSFPIFEEFGNDNSTILYFVQQVEDITEYIALQQIEKTQKKQIDIMKHEIFERISKINEINEQLNVVNKDFEIQKIQHKSQEQIFVQLLESSPDSIIIVNKEGIIQRVNKQTETLFLYERNEIIGQKVEILIPNKFKGKHPQLRDSFFKNPKLRQMGENLDLYGLRKDGKTFVVEIMLNPIVTAENEDLVIAAVRDVTTKKVQEQLFIQLLENSPDGIIIINKDGIIQRVNKRMETLFLYTIEELIDNKIEMLIPDKFKGKHPDLRSSFFKNPKLRQMGENLDLYGLRKDGKTFVVEIMLNPILTAENEDLVIAAVRDVTTKKVQEQLFIELLESSPDSIVIVNREGIIKKINRQTESLFLYTRDELIGNKIEMLIPERYRNKHHHHRSNFFQNPTHRSMSKNLELYGLRKDGSEFVVEIILNPMETAEKEQLTIAAIRDVTDRKSQELLFIQLMESSPDALVIIDKDGIIQKINKQTESLFLYERNEILGQKVEILIPERFKNKHPQLRSSFFNNPKLRQMGHGLTLYGLRKDNTEFSSEIMLSPLNIDTMTKTLTLEKNNELVIAAIRDITERKVLLEASPDAVILVDNNGNIINVNKETENLFQYDSNELIGKKIEILIPNRYKNIHPQRRDKYFSNPSNRPMGLNFDLYGKKKDDIEFNAEVMLTSLLINGQKHAVATIRNITERKKKEQMDNQNRLILEQNRENFIANISHELRTPLNGIIGITSLLLDTDVSNEQQKLLQDINQCSLVLLNTITDILDYSKISKNVHLEIKKFLLFSTIESVINSFDKRIKEKNLKLNINIPSIQDFYVQSDQEKITVIFNKLIDNAIKFTEKGSVSINCSIMKDTFEYTEIKCEIIDTGVGIPEGITLFEKFQIIDASMTRNHEGSGLGLNITKYLLDLLGGTISYTSEYGVGSTFWFIISFKKSIDDKEIINVKPKFSKSETGKNILVVEDNAINMTVTVKLLEKLGYHIDQARDGSIAVNKWKEKTYDLIFMDCQMPIMDGYTATEQIRQLEKKENSGTHTIICALTAHAQKVDYDRCIKVGMDDYISKPVFINTLQSTLQKWLK